MIYERCGKIIDSYLDVQRLVQNFREFEEFRKVAISEPEYNILKQLTTPFIYTFGDDVFIKRANRVDDNDEQIAARFIKFKKNINDLLDMPHITHSSYNLLCLHQKITNQQLDPWKDNEDEDANNAKI